MANFAIYWPFLLSRKEAINEGSAGASVQSLSRARWPTPMALIVKKG
jgi:hypothetical protein